jgi:hypothetical protein
MQNPGKSLGAASLICIARRLSQNEQMFPACLSEVAVVGAAGIVEGAVASTEDSLPIHGRGATGSFVVGSVAMSTV